MINNIGNVLKVVAAVQTAVSVGTQILKMTDKVRKNCAEIHDEKPNDIDQILEKVLKHKGKDGFSFEIKNDKNKEHLKTFFLKLGILFKKDDLEKNQLKLSSNDAYKLQKIIKDPITHFENLGVNIDQVAYRLNDAKNRFENLVHGGDKNELKHSRLAKNLIALIQGNNTGNLINTESYLEPISLEKLTSSITECQTPEQLKIILNAEKFGNDKNEKISYEEFCENIKLPEDKKLSQSDFKIFQEDNEKIQEKLIDYIPTVQKGDDLDIFKNHTTINFDYNSFFDKNDNLPDNAVSFIQENPEKIRIKLDNKEQLSIAYKTLINQVGIDNVQKIKFSSTNDDTNKMLNFLQNKDYGLLIGELVKEDDSIIEIVKNNNPQIDDITKVIDTYKTLDDRNIDVLDKFIKTLPEPNDTTPSDNDELQTLLSKAFFDKNGVADKFDAKLDNQFIKHNKDILTKIFPSEMERYDEINSFISDKKVKDIFNILKSDGSDISKFTSLDDQAKPYILKDFFESSDYKKATNKKNILKKLSSEPILEPFITQENASIKKDNLFIDKEGNEQRIKFLGEEFDKKSADILFSPYNMDTSISAKENLKNIISSYKKYKGNVPINAPIIKKIIDYKTKEIFNENKVKVRFWRPKLPEEVNQNINKNSLNKEIQKHLGNKKDIDNLTIADMRTLEDSERNN